MDRNNNKKQYLERREILPIFSFLFCPLRYNKDICAQVRTPSLVDIWKCLLGFAPV